MKRISRDDMLMEIARIVAKRSTCRRLNVGAVIAREGRVVSTGYSGAPSGLPHCSPETCSLDHPCTRTIHAEMGAITFAAREGLRLMGCTLYCTHAPCLDCAKAIINTGIKRIVYETPYRKTEGIELLRSIGIIVEQWQEESASTLS